MRILFIGDIFGRPGRTIVHERLPELQKQHDVDLTIANGENAAGGFGITPQIAEELFELGIDVITTGNHVWDNNMGLATRGRKRKRARPCGSY